MEWRGIRMLVRRTIIVAVAKRLDSASDVPSFAPPPQQSPMLGHRASSHTVCSPNPRRSFLILAKDSPLGIEVLRWDGSRGLTMRKIQHQNPVKSKLSPREPTFSHCPTRPSPGRFPQRSHLMMGRCRELRRTSVSSKWKRGKRLPMNG